jgi:hypothetical protein
METPSPQFAGRALVNSTACTGQRPAVESTAGLFCLEDPDQQNDDQNDQENGAKSDVHAPPSFRGRLLFFRRIRPTNHVTRFEKEGRNEARSPSRGRASTLLPASGIRGSRSRGPVGGACPARRRPKAGPPGRPDGLGRTAYCASAVSLRGFWSEPGIPLLCDRRADPPRDHAPQVDLVELLGLSEARSRAQGMRLLQMGHVSLTTTRTR